MQKKKSSVLALLANGYDMEYSKHQVDPVLKHKIKVKKQTDGILSLGPIESYSVSEVFTNRNVKALL